MTLNYHYPPNWRVRLLTVLDAPATPENLRFLKAWGVAEGGYATENPLNTTFPLPWFVSSNYNSAGVKNYSNATAGVCATAVTLAQRYYDTLTAALRAGTHTAEEIVDLGESALKTWGTTPDHIRQVLKTI